MSQNLPSLLFVDAMVGAAAYAHPLDEVGVPPPSAAVMEQIRRAQVDIYCSHNSQAISAIREARRELNSGSTPVVADTLVALDEAAWFVRHNDFLHAEEALEVALDKLKLAQIQKLRLS